MNHPTNYQSVRGKLGALALVLSVALVSPVSVQAQGRSDPPSRDPDVIKIENDAKARQEIALQVKGRGQEKRNDAAVLAQSVGNPGKSNPLGLTSDREVSAATADIAQRLKASRSGAAAREFFKETLKANERLLKSKKSELSSNERVQLLLQNARIVGLEFGEVKKAQAIWEEIASLAPDDPRAHVLYDELSQRDADVFPPVRRYPNPPKER